MQKLHLTTDAHSEGEHFKSDAQFLKIWTVVKKKKKIQNSKQDIAPEGSSGSLSSSTYQMKFEMPKTNILGKDLEGPWIEDDVKETHTMFHSILLCQVFSFMPILSCRSWRNLNLSPGFGELY